MKPMILLILFIGNMVLIARLKKNLWPKVRSGAVCVGQEVMYISGLNAAVKNISAHERK